MRRGSRSAQALVVLAVVAAVGLSACSPAKVGAAAIVGDSRITSAQVNNASAGIRQGNPQLAQGEGLERTVLYYLVIAPWVLPTAAANGQGVSNQEATKLLPDAKTPDPDSVLVLRTFIALQKMQQAGLSEPLAQVQKDIAAANPKLSPRYGTFDAKSMSIVDAPPNWVVPQSEPTETTTEQP
ncbi:hypothetical protein ACPPVT_04585 [Angustibacter sp. McL0619]|uniref:hypothetical protein n=1 Tax=Angustibacter sp. McL0619 TaxID=3415676 RepID=UPI003CF28D79